MTPRALMITGATMGLFGAAVAVVRSDVGQFAVFLFAAGAVFGKGYGVYEERTRGAVRRRAGEDDVRGMQIALEKAWESNRERQAEIDRLRSEREYIVGCNDGFDVAMEQALEIVEHENTKWLPGGPVDVKGILRGIAQQLRTASGTSATAPLKPTQIAKYLEAAEMAKSGRYTINQVRAYMGMAPVAHGEERAVVASKYEPSAIENPAALVREIGGGDANSDPT